MVTAAAEAPAESTSAPARAPGRGKLFAVLGIVGLIITIQVVLTLMLMPRAPTEKPTGKTETTEKAETETAAEPDHEHTEVSMGDFNCTNNTAAPGVVIHLDFKLTAIAAPGKDSALQSTLKSHAARIRQIVGKIVRSSSLEDLNDPNLATIKRLVREEVNRLLRKSLITEVVVSDVRHVEQ